MRLVCFECHKSVSTEVPDDTVVRATMICPECLALADPAALEKALASMSAARVFAQRLARIDGEQ